MSIKLFNESDINILLQNPNVLRLSTKSITYTDEFKAFFIKEYLLCNSPTRIFEKAGFDKNMLGYKRIERAATRWKKAYKEKGELGLMDSRKINSGRPLTRDLSEKEIIENQKAKIKLLEAEVELLKKIDSEEGRLVRSRQALKTREIFSLIQMITKKYKLKNVISYLCKCSGVSRSGYYNYVGSSEKQREREIQDEKIRDIILTAFNHRGFKKGSRSIKMTLNGDSNIIFNRKRIQRIMRKYHIICPIRQRNPYKQMRKATIEHATFKNILNRNFKQNIPGKVLLTDITYLKYGKGQTAYLSTIKDACTNEILGYNTSKIIDLELVIETFKRINKKLPLAKDAFVHSDQGWHYTNPTFQKFIKSMKLGQSMSRKGNCWDNAPQESFFGHMKDEINIKKCSTYTEIEVIINDYMDYYNNHRYQWNLKQMTPVQYRNHLLTV